MREGGQKETHREREKLGVVEEEEEDKDCEKQSNEKR